MRRTKLKTNGRNITDVQAVVVPLDNGHKKLVVTVEAEGVSRVYDFMADVHYASVDAVREKLLPKFSAARHEYWNVEISEDKNHPNLFVQFQGLPILAFTGRRVS